MERRVETGRGGNDWGEGAVRDLSQSPHSSYIPHTPLTHTSFPHSPHTHTLTPLNLSVLFFSFSRFLVFSFSRFLVFSFPQVHAVVRIVLEAGESLVPSLLALPLPSEHPEAHLRGSLLEMLLMATSSDDWTAVKETRGVWTSLREEVQRGGDDALGAAQETLCLAHDALHRSCTYPPDHVYEEGWSCEMREDFEMHRKVWRNI